MLPVLPSITWPNGRPNYVFPIKITPLTSVAPSTTTTSVVTTTAQNLPVTLTSPTHIPYIFP